MSTSTISTLVGTLVAAAITLAVSFGVNITTDQRNAILTFVGVLCAVVIAAVSWIETHKIRSATAVVVASKGTTP